MTSTIRHVFRRSNSHSHDSPEKPTFNLNGLSAAMPASNNLSAGRKSSMSVSANNSPFASPAVTPASHGSPVSTVNSNEAQGEQEPSQLTQEKRAATGFHLRSTPKITFSTPSRHDRRKSTSTTNVAGVAELSGPDYFSRPAESGVGLKARRISVSLPDDFVVDTVDLDKEFQSASKLPGRRGKLIGKGATSTVKLMTRRGHGDEIYAVKEFRKKGQTEDADEYDKKVKSEYSIAHSLRHPNLVESVRLCTYGGRWNVVMEYCAQGELYSLVQKKYLTLDDKLCLWKQLLRGVAYLHGHGIAHRDIKLENLLMTNEGQLKITDFGVSEVFCGEHPGLRTAAGECGKNMKELRTCAPGICGSLPYIAPEVLEKKGELMEPPCCCGSTDLYPGEYDPRPLDVWSTAIVLISLIFTGQPWAQASLDQPMYAKFHAGFSKFLSEHPDEPITDTNYPRGCGPIFMNLPKPAIKIILFRMLHPQPAKRASINDIIGDRWIKTIECCSQETEDEALKLTKTKSGKFDAGKAGAAGLQVKKQHNHLPPKAHRIPQHRFDMGDGYS